MILFSGQVNEFSICLNITAINVPYFMNFLFLVGIEINVKRDISIGKFRMYT